MIGEKLSVIPPHNYECTICHYRTSRKNDYNRHKLTLKHQNCEKREEMEKKLRQQYHCSFCSIQTYNQTDYNKHILTTKHKNNETNYNNGEYNKNKCVHCNKIYSSQSNLWKHKQKCIFIEKDTNIAMTMNSITPSLFMEVIKQSKELQNVLVEQTKELQNKLLEKENQLLEQNKEHQQQILELAKNQYVVNNNTNQQFNLQFFLNETCKDAMNIVDFINSFQLTNADFETTGKLGFVDGISRIFIKELKKMETEKLPIHCTDFKRETVYIKDNNIWEKENNEKKRLKWAIDKIAQLNLNQLQQWQQEFPECRENNTKENEHFFKLASVALGGRGKDEEDKYREKIMRNVLKEVVLDKQSNGIK